MVSSLCCRPSPLLPAIYPRPAGSAAREKERRQEEKAQQVRESGMGRNGDRRGFPERGWGFYAVSLAHGARCTLRAELDGEGGVSRRRCEPSLGVGVAVSVVQRSGRGLLGFSSGSSESRPPRVGSIGERAGRGWFCALRWSSCTVV
jgi:hypothetical protein